jgi:succinate-semialdehyde dehydrogenase/glutarate-semialdehyde dehydrogenase
MAKTIKHKSATGEKISEYDRITSSEALEIIAASKRISSLKHKTFAERAKLIYALADVPRHKTRIQLATQRNG